MRGVVIAKEGLLLGGVPFIAGLLFLWIDLTILGILLSVIGIFIIFFFRQPNRLSISGDDIIFAPADGKIIQIQEEHEDSFFKEVIRKISIFMSLFNVHITYAPVSGNVDYIQYRRGKFTRADRLSEGPETNENNFIGIRNGNGKVAIRQVAGCIARRVVCDVKLGDELVPGARIGMVKFGSRIDVYLPRDWQINVSVGERSKAGCTVLARKR